MRRKVLMSATIGAVALPIASVFFARPLLAPSLITMFAVHAIAAVATFIPSSQIWGPVRSRFTPADREVWLTIDDGPAGDTGAFLDVLQMHGAKATFFVVGEDLEKHRGAAQLIAEAGHEVACHTHSHPAGWFWAYGRRAIRQEVDRCNELITRETKRHVGRFRPPVGFRNGWTHDVLEERGLELISWSHRGFDGIEGRSVDQIVARIVRDVEPGAILMIHQGRPSSLAILERLLAELERRNLKCIVPE